MRIGRISQRRFSVLAGSIASAHVIGAQTAGVSATTVVNRIVDGLGGDKTAAGADGFKAGDPTGQVRGIATTAMATMDVLTGAVKAGANLIITHEPTFFGRSDGPTPAGAAGGRGAPAGIAAEAKSQM